MAHLVEELCNIADPLVVMARRYDVSILQTPSSTDFENRNYWSLLLEFLSVRFALPCFATFPFGFGCAELHRRCFTVNRTDSVKLVVEPGHSLG